MIPDCDSNSGRFGRGRGYDAKGDVGNAEVRAAGDAEPRPERGHDTEFFSCRRAQYVEIKLIAQAISFAHSRRIKAGEDTDLRHGDDQKLVRLVTEPRAACAGDGIIPRGRHVPDSGALHTRDRQPPSASRLLPR